VETVVIIAPYNYDQVLASRMPEASKVSVGAESAWTIEVGFRHVYLARNDMIRDELEPADLQKLLEVVRAPVFYSLDFSDIALAKEVLVALVDDPVLMVDNGHGTVLPGPSFAQLLRERLDWDWRGNRA
jgi:hypothetical protein